MAIDDAPVQVVVPQEPNRGSNSIMFVVVFVVLAALAVGEFFTVRRMNTMREQLAAQQNQMRDDLTGQLKNQVTNRLSAIEQQNAQALESVKTELDDAAKRMGAQRGELKRARTMVTQLQDEQKTQTAQLEQEPLPEGRPAASWRSDPRRFHDEDES